MNCIEILLGHDSNTMSTKNTAGLLPIQCLVMSSHTDVHAVDMLLEHDPSLVHVVDGEGNGLLHHARGQKVLHFRFFFCCLLKIFIPILWLIAF